MLQAIDSDHERYVPMMLGAAGPHSRSWSAGGIFASIIPREIYFYVCVKLVGPYAQATLANT